MTNLRDAFYFLIKSNEYSSNSSQKPAPRAVLIGGAILNWELYSGIELICVLDVNQGG